MLTKSTARKVLFGTYIIAVLISMLLCDVKFRSLGFHNRDYAYYLEFSSKLLNKNSAHTYSMNPEGGNWLFMQGPEGINDFQQATHFEPIKYLYAILYRIFQTPYVIFLFTSLLFFIPLPYFALAIPLNSESEIRTALSLGMLYLFYPSVFFVPAYDMRPYIFLAPFFLLAILSIKFEKPLWEQILWLNLLFLAREEAIILGAVVVLYGILKNIRRPIHKPLNLILPGIFYGIWVTGTAVFMRWAGYSIVTRKLPPQILGFYEGLINHSPSLIIKLVIACVVGLAILWFVWNKFKDNHLFQGILDILVVGSALIPISYQLILDHKPFPLVSYFFSPRYYLHYIVSMLFIFMIASQIKIKFSGRLWQIFMVIGGAMIVFIQVLAPGGFRSTYSKFKKAASPAKIIWSFKEGLDPYASNLLVDYNTHQAFYNFENVFAYERLPWSILSGNRRFYPTNRSALQTLVSERIDYIIVARSSMRDTNAILSESSVQGKVVFKNNKFIVLEIIRE